MTKPKKEEYKKLILEVLYNINETLDRFDWTESIAPYAGKDNMGNPNWISEAMKIKGQLKIIQEGLKEMIEE